MSTRKCENIAQRCHSLNKAAHLDPIRLNPENMKKSGSENLQRKQETQITGYICAWCLTVAVKLQ